MEKGGRPRAVNPADPDKPKAGGQWSPEEEQQLRDAFVARKPIGEISKTHGRTTGAITARLMKLGLIENTFANRQGRGNVPATGMSRRVVTGDHPRDGGRPTSAETGPNPPALPPELSQEEKDKLPF
jgi:hypothetical protein